VGFPTKPHWSQPQMAPPSNVTSASEEKHRPNGHVDWEPHDGSTFLCSLRRKVAALSGRLRVACRPAVERPAILNVDPRWYYDAAVKGSLRRPLAALDRCLCRTWRCAPYEALEGYPSARSTNIFAQGLFVWREVNGNPEGQPVVGHSRLCSNCQSAIRVPAIRDSAIRVSAIRVPAIVPVPKLG